MFLTIPLNDRICICVNDTTLVVLSGFVLKICATWDFIVDRQYVKNLLVFLPPRSFGENRNVNSG